MSVRVLFFGATSDLTGNREQFLEFQQDRTVAQLVEHLTVLFPRLAHLNLLVSINQEYAGFDATVCDGDEVAIFTAVSGG